MNFSLCFFPIFFNFKQKLNQSTSAMSSHLEPLWVYNLRRLRRREIRTGFETLKMSNKTYRDFLCVWQSLDQQKVECRYVRRKRKLIPNGPCPRGGTYGIKTQNNCEISYWHRILILYVNLSEWVLRQWIRDWVPTDGPCRSDTIQSNWEDKYLTGTKQCDVINVQSALSIDYLILLEFWDQRVGSGKWTRRGFRSE